MLTKSPTEHGDHNLGDMGRNVPGPFFGLLAVGSPVGRESYSAGDFG